MTDTLHDDHHQIDSEEQLAPSAEHEGRARPGWAGWLISASFHVMMLLIMYGIYWVVKVPDTETMIPHTSLIDPPAKKPDQEKKRDMLDKLPILVEKETDTPDAINQLTVEPTETSSEEPNDNPQSKGREEAEANTETGGPALYVAIGAGGFSSGLHGVRGGGGHHRAVALGGGTGGSEKAVDAALRWFKRHQSANGSWDAVNYYKNCTDNGKCEPGAETHGSAASYDVAMTSYALLCFLGRGYDHTSGMFKSVVKRGLDYLLSVQKPDGYFGERNYENAIATMAICEAIELSDDKTLMAPAQKAVDQIIAHQNKDPAAVAADAVGYGVGMGWDYVGPDNRNDSSVSGWNVMALKDAMGAGLTIGTSLEGAKHWLTTVWKKQNPDWAKIDPYKGESRFPYTYLSDTTETQIAPAPAAGAPGPNATDLTCVGGLCAVFLGHKAGDPMLESMANYVMDHYVPKTWPPNIYYMYYNTTTIFQVGGTRWHTWNTSVRDLLVNAQRHTKDCFNGSWDWNGGSFIGGDTGRVLTTAYATLCLEVYYRYLKENGAL